MLFIIVGSIPLNKQLAIKALICRKPVAELVHPGSPANRLKKLRIIITLEWHLISYGSKTLPLLLWMMAVLKYIFKQHSYTVWK